MVLEATMVCLDNSEPMRNGDYAPDRWQAQTDAVNIICGAKTQANPENTVGVLAMAGKNARVVVTPTGDLGKILGSMHGLQVEGDGANIISGVQVAQLALKHRQNKNQRQRIILFAGSPIESEPETLVKVGKKLKKNNVAVDIVSFGDIEANKEKLEALLAAVNSNDNSHLIEVPPGPLIMSDVLISSPMLTADGASGFAAAAAAGAAAAAQGGAAAGGGDFEFGVDPNLDPELALALRVSMEEERARQEAAAKKASEEGGAGDDGGDAAGPSDAAAGAAAGAVAPEGQKDQTAGDDQAGGVADMEADDDALLQQALAMSVSAAAAASAGDAEAAVAAPPEQQPAQAMEEDADLALALQMSMEDGGAGAATAGAVEAVSDPAFMTSVLSSLPGVDPNDPTVQEALAGLAGSGEKKADGAQEGKEEDHEG